jgi:hypothetical protein
MANFAFQVLHVFGLVLLVGNIVVQLSGRFWLIAPRTPE